MLFENRVDGKTMQESEYQERVQRALGLHDKNFNCAQCVACATCDLVGLEPGQMFKLMEGFGGGMGGFDQTCGAISGGVAVLGYANSNGIDVRTSKPSTYALVSDFVDAFRQTHEGCTTCKDLRPEEPDRVKPVCNGYIAAGTRMVMDFLIQGGAA